MRGGELHGDDDRRLWNEPECGQVLALKMQGDCLAEVGRHFIQGVTLGDHRDLLAGSDPSGLHVRRDARMDRRP
jgi:hypothetical protein